MVYCFLLILFCIFNWLFLLPSLKKITHILLYVDDIAHITQFTKSLYMPFC